MRWNERLYFGVSLEGKEEEIKRSVEEGTASRSLRLIMPAGNGTDQLDIRRASDDLPEDALLFGAAKGRRECIELIVRITQDCVETTGGADLLAFLTGRSS